MTPEKLAALADAIDPKAEVGTNILSREQVAALHVVGIYLAQADDLRAASDALRTLPQGYAAGVEAAAKYHDDAAIKLRKHMKRFSNEDYSCVASEEAAAHETHATAIRSLSSADAVVEGWVLVPKEPTEEMRLAGIAAEEICDTTIGYVATIYRAMISATPPAVRGK